MTPVTIRRATGAAAGFIAGLVPRFVEFVPPAGRDPARLAETFGRALKDALAGGADVFVAESDAGEPLGFVHLHATTDLDGRPRAHVGDLAVTVQAEGAGVGRALTRFAEEWAAEQGHDRIGLTALATNERAIGFYRRLGYEPLTVGLVKPVPPAAPERPE